MAGPALSRQGQGAQGAHRETWRTALGIPGATPIPDSVAERVEGWTRFAMGYREEQAGRAQQALKHYREAAREAPGQPLILVRQAACLLELQRYEEALTLARAATAGDSLSAEAYWCEGASLVSLGRLEEAVAPLRRRIALVDDRRALSLLTGILERLGHFELALEPLNQLVALGASPHQLERRAALLTRLGRFEDALRDYWSILEIAPEHPVLREQMVALLRQMGRRGELIEFYRALSQRLPGDKDVVWKLIEQLVQDEQWDAAEDQLRGLLAADPTDGLPLVQLGLVAYRRGDAPGAFDLLAQAETLGAPAELLNRWRMRFHFALAQPDSALANAGRLLALQPEEIEGWRIQSLCQAETGQLEDALVSVERWAALDESNSEPLVLGAAICRDRGYWRRGLSFIRRAVARAPGDQGLLVEYAAFLEANDEVAEAAEVLVKLLEREPGHAVALNFLGYMWADRGINLAEAEEKIAKALEVEPDNPAYLDSMGWLWYKRGDLRRAEQWLDRAAEKGGRHPEIFQHLAQVKLERKKVKEAREILERGLRANPGDRSLMEFLQSLEDER